jgi:hypothetical protein
MSETEPAIIQGGHPFKVEAVLSKTGGINALAKHAPDLLKGDDLGRDHREAIPGVGALNDHRIQIDASLPDNAATTGPLREDQFDTQHREQFDDPSRRLKTHQRVKIQGSETASASSGQSPAEDVYRTESNRSKAPRRKTSAVLSGDPHPDKDEFHRRIEQIKSSNESVGKNLEALEKSTPAHGVIPPGE